LDHWRGPLRGGEEREREDRDGKERKERDGRKTSRNKFLVPALNIVWNTTLLLMIAISLRRRDVELNCSLCVTACVPNVAFESDEKAQW